MTLPCSQRPVLHYRAGAAAGRGLPRRAGRAAPSSPTSLSCLRHCIAELAPQLGGVCPDALAALRQLCAAGALVLGSTRCLVELPKEAALGEERLGQAPGVFHGARGGWARDRMAAWWVESRQDMWLAAWWHAVW